MIGIVFIGNLLYCPYLYKYIKLIEECKKQYEILYWDRQGLNEAETVRNTVCYSKRVKLVQNPVRKSFEFLGYRKWVISKIQNRKYEKLILLSTLSAMILPSYIIRKYTNRFIFDIRDYSYEKNVFFKLMEKNRMKKSYFVTISSTGFLKFLPVFDRNRIVVTHNISQEIPKSACFRKKLKGRINFVWLGAIRYFDKQVEIIKKLNEDGRFNVIFHGIGPQYEKLKAYVSENGFEHVAMTGRYNDREKAELLMEADIINNCYESNMETKYALSNKFYDAFVYHIPQLVEKDSYKEKILKRYKSGIAMNIDDKNLPDQLYDFYMDIAPEKFDSDCEKFLEKVKRDEIHWNGKVKEFVMK